MPKFIPKIPVTPEGRRELYKTLKSGILEKNYPFPENQIFDFDGLAEFSAQQAEDNKVLDEIYAKRKSECHPTHS